MRIALALILVVGLTTTVNADAWTWFSLESDAGAAAADKGSDLNIVYPTCPGGVEVITVHQWLEVADITLSGVSSDLEYGDDSGFFGIDAMATDVGGWMLQESGAGDVDGWWAFGGARLFGAMITAADGVQHVASFELTINHSGGPETHLINAGIGSQAWASTPIVPFNVYFGDDPIGILNSDKLTMTPTISVTCLPEPATIALLGFGALALIRRR